MFKFHVFENIILSTKKTWTDVFTIVHDRALMEAPADHVNGEACQLTKRKRKWSLL